jgi:hypothetical protein
MVKYNQFIHSTFYIILLFIFEYRLHTKLINAMLSRGLKYGTLKKDEINVPSVIFHDDGNATSH